MSLDLIPEEGLNPQEIETTLNVVHGASPEELAALQKCVFEGLLTRLGVDLQKAN